MSDSDLCYIPCFWILLFNFRVATNDLPTIKTGSESHKLRRWTKRFIRVVYILNICIGIGGLTYLTVTQKQGKYRCQSVTVSFGDDTFEEAYVTNEDGVLEKRLLIFSHFNGVYVENGKILSIIHFQYAKLCVSQ